MPTPYLIKNHVITKRYFLVLIFNLIPATVAITFHYNLPKYIYPRIFIKKYHWYLL